MFKTLIKALNATLNRHGYGIFPVTPNHPNPHPDAAPDDLPKTSGCSEDEEKAAVIKRRLEKLSTLIKREEEKQKRGGV